MNNYTTVREDEAERALIRIRHVEDVTAFISIDEQQELIGGITTLQRKTNYPESSRRAGIQGRVIVQFTVDGEGYPRDFMVLRG